LTNLRVDTLATPEVSYIDCSAEPGRQAVYTITLPAFAGAAQGDFVVIYPGGVACALWLNKDGDGTEPDGAIYTAATVKSRVDIVTGNTAAQVATAFLDAITNDGITGVQFTAGAGGALVMTHDVIGSQTTPVPKNAAEAAAGSITVATTTAGVNSALQNKYCLVRSPAGTAYYAWFNVNAEGADPAVAASTAIEVALNSFPYSASGVATALAAAIDAEAAFTASASGSRVTVTAAASGDAVDASAGDSGFTVATHHDGAPSLGSNPGDTVASLSMTPSNVGALS
jgi:hypothetical protein